MSVAIPVFNGERFLAEAISSVLEQTVPADEIKVYDNCSTDRSVEVARRLLPEIDVVESPRNVGAVANFNRAALDSDPDAAYFAWLAADDLFAPRFLERCMFELERFPDAPACLTGVQFISPDGRSLGTQTDLDLSSDAPSRRLRAFVRRPRWTEFYCLYRRQALLDSPMMRDEYGADVQLTWWFVLRSPLAVTTDLLLSYRVYPEKTVEEMATALNPSAPSTQWRKRRLWLQLWNMTYEPGVEESVGRIARRELVRALAHRTWMVHMLEDVFERWPITKRGAARLPAAVRRVVNSR